MRTNKQIIVGVLDHLGITDEGGGRQALADHLGVSYTTVCNWWSGKHEVDLTLIARKIPGISIDKLLYGTGEIDRLKTVCNERERMIHTLLEMIADRTTPPMHGTRHTSEDNHSGRAGRARGFG